MKGSTPPESAALTDAARICERALSSQGLKVIARVWESDRAFDMALGLTRGARTVIRCVVRAEPSDYRALSTMLGEEDFDRAVLVYTGEDQPHLADEIESYPLSHIHELAAFLAKESAK